VGLHVDTTVYLRVIIGTPSSIGERSIVMSVSVCLCVCVVCLFVRHNSFETTRPMFMQFFVHVTYDRGSVSLRRRSDNPVYG